MILCSEMAGEVVVENKEHLIHKQPRKEQPQVTSSELHHKQLVAMNIHSLGERLGL